VNGRPAISYISAPAELRYVRALDVDGATWGVPVVVHVGGGPKWSSLAIVNGRPAIAFLANQGTTVLKYVRALDPDGAAWGSALTVTPNVIPNASVSLAVVNGRPAIVCHAYQYVRAQDPDGAAWGNPVWLYVSGFKSDWYSSFAVVAGNPAVALSSYGSYPFYGLFFRRSTDADGTVWTQGVAIARPVDGDAGDFVSMSIVNGNPAVSYAFSGAVSQLWYSRAMDPEGSTWADPVVVETGSCVDTSLAVVNGNPAISYARAGSLWYVRAADADGTSWGAPEIVDTSGGFTSLEVVNSHPAISYRRSGGLGYAHDGPVPARLLSFTVD